MRHYSKALLMLWYGNLKRHSVLTIAERLKKAACLEKMVCFIQQAFQIHLYITGRCPPNNNLLLQYLEVSPLTNPIVVKTYEQNVAKKFDT